MSDWSRYDVPALWGELRSRSVDAGWAQWAAWQKMSDLLADQANRMMGYQADMEDAWPPSGTAAGYFHERLAELISALRVNSVSAGRIGAALAQVNGASFAAHEAMRQLNDQWQARNGEVGADLTLRRRELNKQAYAVMNEYESTVVEASKSFIPPEFVPSDSEPGGEAVNRFSNEGDGSDDVGGSGSSEPYDGADTTVPGTGSDGGSEGAGFPGGAPELAGVPGGPPGPVGLPSTGGSPNGSGAAPNPLVPVTMPSAPGLPGPGRVTTNPVGAARPVAGPAGSGRRAMPVGGVIGSQPPAGPPRPGVPGGRGPLPPGGVVGGRQSVQPHGGTPLTGGAGRSGLGGPLSGRRSGQQEEYRDPGIGAQWSAAEGGPAVIEAKPEPEHSPGPGVIGIDR
ncbi:hypothetical protein Val02_92490 [Virgisporangium aliadipatigenens]|uniref:PPE family domain-containing protein n=1 Tax=Virgisporangium aliadipatigenens TaxID=741659 RepID=A0A8J4DWK5_9ACTN|nr:hypothetical protein Val02_92490 [Virgisporangium aliadipatigenens]